MSYPKGMLRDWDETPRNDRIRNDFGQPAILDQGDH